MPTEDWNRVPRSLNYPLIRVAGKNVLLDTGLATKDQSRRQDTSDLDIGKLVFDVRRHAREPEEIDYVIFSHLHWDHVGGATDAETGGLKTTFPRALRLAQRTDWEAPTHPKERNRAGYTAEDLAPLLGHRQLEFADGDTEMLPGLGCKVTGGHTSGQQIAVLEVDGRKACPFQDLVQTLCHLPVLDSQSYYAHLGELLNWKRELLAEAEQEQ